MSAISDARIDPFPATETDAPTLSVDVPIGAAIAVVHPCQVAELCDRRPVRTEEEVLEGVGTAQVHEKGHQDPRSANRRLALARSGAAYWRVTRVVQHE